MNVRWSDDSRILTFQDAITAEDEGVISPTSSWHTYRVGTDTDDELVNSDFWPFYPGFLKDDPTNQFASAVDLGGQISFVFLSPNQRYAVYAAPKLDELASCWPLAITDLQTGDTALVVSNDFEEIVHTCTLKYMAYFDIRWSDDSSAFTIELHWLPDDRSYHVTGLESLGTEIIASRLEIFSDDGDLIGYGDPLDISADGDFALGFTGAGIFLWDSQDPRHIQRLVRTEIPVIAGMFVPNNEQKIMYIAETGLMEYDSETQETTILDASINSEWVHDAWFSPDGKRVALIDKNTTKLYVLDVPLS